MRVDVAGDGALREGVGDVGPVPVRRRRRRVFLHDVDVPGERRLGLGAVDGELAALHPVAAELAEDRRIDVHVLAGAGDAAQRCAPDAIVRRVQRRGVRHVGFERVGRLQSLRVVEVLAIDLDGDFAVIGHAVELAVDAVGACARPE